MNINPPMGIPLRGYFKERFADGIIDDLEINALALECDGIRLLLISIDHCGIEQEMNENLRKCASEVTGVPMAHIILSATHTHTAPFIDKYSDDELVVEYNL